ncbi:uncharacterized protein MELLADRAFT_91610 [Melampsora larici-populina 98AG31]|uniref:GCM domain-containing protein n=1 Tax=Melampsora larici-populina (strain 98AG31 / pathotype 3-4-7) TaxID=747676 RepID=F4RZN3_MELLP|nr:uncharacterized protein MELLADRAFT_91610 [Melampsora larici-populina 98AG31]EGG02158.1 hypothetical protein MELLADRAFT_91610 [Melampsora larici-populina 98AG31]
MRTETTKKSDWIVRRYYCLGVIKCSEDGCALAASPPTGPNKIAESLTSCPISTCDGLRTHIKCDAVCRFDAELDKNGKEGWGLLRHQGTHQHEWAESKKADPISKEKLKEKVLNDPKTGPLGMKVGQAHTRKDPIESVTDIHTSFGHADRLGIYLRRVFLRQAGIMTNSQDPESGDKWLQSMMDWSKKGLRVVSSSIAGEDAHISFQTGWMAEVLVEPDERSTTYTGGLLSDVTYRFFKMGYLLTTSKYCETIKRWVPVLFSWLGGLQAEHYKIHFKNLLQQIQKTKMTDKEKGMMVEQVVDLSLAQKVGFQDAYMEVFKCNDKNVALAKLHGCEWHYLQAVARLKKNSKIVKPQQKLTISSNRALGRRNELRRLFPLAKRWLEWWSCSDIQAMLFPARKRLPLDNPPLPEEDSDADEDVDDEEIIRRHPELPATTNGQESMHRVYYLLCKGKCPVIPGIIQLIAFAQCMEKDYQQVKKGISITYGGQSEKTWQDLVKAIGMAPPTKRKFTRNDGRAPDTTEELLGTQKSTKPPKLGRPVGSQNINHNPLTTYQSYSAGTNEGTQNRCWKTATLETLYALFSPTWSQFLTVNSTNLVNELIRHFTARCKVEFNGDNFGHSMSRWQTILHKAIQKLSESYTTGQFASANGFMEFLLANVEDNKSSL